MTSKQHIAIVGAGIGGVAAAHALHRSGFRVSLFEQAVELSEIGSGLSIWENGLHALEAIGLRGAVEAAGRPWPEYEIYRRDKRPIVKRNTPVSLGGSTSPIIAKRGALFAVLRDTLPSQVVIHKRFKVRQVVGNALVGEDGRQCTADVIIGADGAHSQVRKVLTSRQPRFCNQVCFRGIAKSSALVGQKSAEIFNEPHHRVGYFSLPNDEVYWFDIVDSDVKKLPFESVREALAELSSEIAALITHTPNEEILCHPLEEMEPVTTPHEFVALLGDAAHPMQPSLGQGACLALEDAVVLASCLRAHDTAADGIRAYVKTRKKRWKLYYRMCQQLSTSALDKGMLGRKLAIARMVHTPEWSLSTFGRRMFAFPERSVEL